MENNMEYTHASFEPNGLAAIDTESLPTATVAAMVRRGLNHFFGNELAAKITPDALAKWSEKNPTGNTAEYIDAVYASAYESVINGTVGTGRSNSGRTTDRVMQMAISIAIATLRGNPTKYGLLRVWSKNDGTLVRQKAIKLVKANPLFVERAAARIAEDDELTGVVADIDEPMETESDETETAADETEQTETTPRRRNRRNEMHATE